MLLTLLSVSAKVQRLVSATSLRVKLHRQSITSRRTAVSTLVCEDVSTVRQRRVPAGLIASAQEYQPDRDCRHPVLTGKLWFGWNTTLHSRYPMHAGDFWWRCMSQAAIHRRWDWQRIRSSDCEVRCNDKISTVQM